MSVTYEQAKAMEEQARAVVREKTAVRDEARTAFEAARTALEEADKTRLAAKESMNDLQNKLRATRDALMPNEAASKRAQLELESAIKSLEEARIKREEAESALTRLEGERDEASLLLDGAQEDVDKTGEFEVISRTNLDERVQRATDAQRSLDAALIAIEEARSDVERARDVLQRAQDASASIPNNDDELRQTVRQREEGLAKAIAASEEATRTLAANREGQAVAERTAQSAKEAYEKAQSNLRTAILAADKAEARMRDAQMRADLEEENAAELQARAVADYAAAGDVRSAAMAVNARALTELADADVEAIRLRIASDESAVALDESNAARARAERELREAREALLQSRGNRKQKEDELSALEKVLHEAQQNLQRLELIGRETAEENEAAQQGLREMQEQAVRYGQESREAASVLDGRRHELSDIVSAIEVARVDLQALKQKERDAEMRVDVARGVCASADRALDEAHAFMKHAQDDIEQQRNAMEDAERRMESLGIAFRKADEAYSTAQRDLDVASADLTDAEVSVIMAEIDSRT